MRENKDKFTYVYTASSEKMKREAEEIRDFYSQKSEEENSFERLKKLDKKVKDAPTVLGLCLGIFGVLIFGLGMSLILHWGEIFFGVIVASLGSPPMIFAHKAYNKLLKRNKEKYGEEIIALTEEILKNQK